MKMENSERPILRFLWLCGMALILLPLLPLGIAMVALGMVLTIFAGLCYAAGFPGIIVYLLLSNYVFKIVKDEYRDRVENWALIFCLARSIPLWFVGVILKQAWDKLWA